ncbi:MAG TPA: hypothetical protein VE954_27820 [Oligoflexus sp.]|uniref:hypothetical protein n=1 Tax=Oligoflexus sp. TaxID=1971216 RepID=UPI002D67953C|nr:hypothetical protein [Oligoflexus sp.]HYX36933.1 hypothetical protein [Oligoflexus sp.]
MKTLFLSLIVLMSAACGREPSRLLRQGQLPIFDFPLYLTEGAAGRVWKIDRERNMTLLAEGLNDPRGVASDRFQNLYVAEFGSGRVLKFPGGDSNYEVVSENLVEPSVVAVDGFGEVYVSQSETNAVRRLSDNQDFGSYAAAPSALGFGVDDIPLVGVYDDNSLSWGWNGEGAQKADMTHPVNVSIDGTGRVYGAAGGITDGQVIRYHQRSAEGAFVVAEGLAGPLGIAVDLVGNIFIAEQGAGRIILVNYEGRAFSWLTGVEDPQYLAFTQY